MRLRRFNLKIFSILPLLLLSEASSENIQVKPQTSSASPYTHRSKELSLRWPALNKSILNSTVLKAVVKMSTPFNFTEATLKYSKRFFADELKFEARKDVSSLDLEVSNKRIGSKLEKPDLESIRKTLKSKIHSRTSRSPLKWWGSPNEFPNSLPLPRAIWRERINGSSGSNFTNTPILPIDSTPPVRSSVSNTTSNNTFNVNQMWIADLTTVATTELNASNITFYAPSLTPKLEGNMSAQLIPNLTPESLFSDSTTNRPIPSISAVLNCQCGVQSFTGERVGHTTIQVPLHPWIVEISSQKEHLCTGSIINDRYVLTAASCVEGYKKTNIWVTSGLQSKSPRVFGVSKIAIHPKFDANTYASDIALLRLTERMQSTRFTRPICLPLREPQYFHPTAHSVTWIRGCKNRNLKLVETEVELLKNSTTCQETAESCFDAVVLLNATICTSPPNQKNCGGEGGGVLEIYAGKNSYEQIGIASMSAGCRPSELPRIYTDVRRYPRWILFQTQDGNYCREPNHGSFAGDN